MDEPKPCPICGKPIEIHGGPDEWAPTFCDPDSGGDPYFIDCKCGLHFCHCGYKYGYDYREFVEAWNRRAIKKPPSGGNRN